jgi:hypothetical protein
VSGWDALREEARDKLGTWPKRARELFKELIEDASTEMQRELLQRAVAAGHTPAEIHAFADELRGLRDNEAFERCTLDANAPDGHTMAQLLRAEADPLFAYELKGHRLTPGDDDRHGLGPAVPLEVPVHELEAMSVAVSNRRARPKFDSASKPAVARGRTAPVSSSSSAPKRVDLNDLGESIDAVPRSRGSDPGGVPASTGRLMEDLLNEATRELGVSFREQDVDDATLSLEAALASAAAAVARGIPVAVAIGPTLGQHRRLAILLQTSTSAGKRAWQLFDPFSGELCWASEGDLLARAELPFENKANRRITRIALPSVKASP